MAQACGIQPDLIIGDFDSYREDLPDNVETIRLPEMKDDTDTMAAVKLALSRGYNRFMMAGVLGGRPDHTFANYCVLQYIHSQGAAGQLADENNRIFFLSGGALRLRELEGHTVSVFPFACHSCVVTYEGLLYPLVKAKLYTDVSPMGVSNEIVEKEASVSVTEGNALIMVSMGCGKEQ